MPLSRRQLLGGALVGASAALAGCSSSSGSSPTSRAPSVALRQPGSLPFPGRPVGVDQLPQIDHIVVVMMENHSFDNVLGLIGRGDGFAVDRHGRPTATNPDGHGNLVRSFHMPTECQTRGIGNDWRVTHEAYNHGLLDGFVTSTSAESMGYLTKDDLPFTCGLAGTFPIADRYFCSAMAQTDPNRRFLIAGTSLGLIDDTFPPGLPPNGVIFEQLNKYGITWKDYYSSLPTLGVFLPLLTVPSLRVRSRRDRPLLRRRSRGNAPVLQPGGAELREAVRGGSPGRAVRRPVPGRRSSTPSCPVPAGRRPC